MHYCNQINKMVYFVGHCLYLVECCFLSLITYVHSDEITEQVLDVRPKYVFTTTDCLGKVEKAVKCCDQVKVGINYNKRTACMI